MKRTPLVRKTQLRSAAQPMHRARIRPRRSSPRRRTAPKWTRVDWEAANPILMARCGGYCECCGLPLDGQVERAHRLKRRDGGDRLSNVLMLHPRCHAWTHAYPTQAGHLGLILRTHQDPTNVPVFVRAHRWVLLTDDGTTIPTDPPNQGAAI